VQPPVMSVPVQEQVHQPALPEPLVKVVGVAQVLLIDDRAAHRVVVHRPQPQPAPIPVSGQALGEPAQLLLPDPAIVVSVAVAHDHGGVQAGHHHREVGHLEQRPRLVRVKLTPSTPW
jgi:hypothetical protein